MAKVCFELANGDFPIQLTQQGVDRFTVRYGKQVKRDLHYGKAALELGACIMHKLACDGLLDNRTKAEARAERRGVEES